MKKLILVCSFVLCFLMIQLLPAGASEYYPHIACSGQWETEICIINTGSTSITGTFKAFGQDGAAVSEDISITLGVNARREITVGDEFRDSADIRYILFSTEAKSVIGYTKFYIDGRYRVAVPTVSNITTGNLNISHIASNERWWTGVSLVNTTSSEKNLTIRFDDGTTKTLVIAGKSHKAFNIKSLFGNTPQPQLNSAIIQNSEGVIGLELFGSVNQLSGISLKNDTAKKMYYPHITSTGKWWTGIVAYNPSTSPCTLTIKPYSAAGASLTTQSVTLKGQEKYIGNLNDLGLPAESAWFQIESTLAITGFELFGTEDGKLLAGYSGVNISSKKGVFAKIEKDGWTGIAFVNIANSTANIELAAYNNSGNVVATEFVSLNPYQKIVNNPEKLFTEDISGATYIAYSSNRELVGFQLNGSLDNMMLDGLPGMFSAGDMSEYDGSFHGTYNGDASGDWCFDISDGNIDGWAWDIFGDDFELTGGLSEDGSLAVGSADDATMFSGIIEPNGNVIGNWSWNDPFGVEPDEEGTFQGTPGGCPYGDITVDDEIEMVINETTESLLFNTDLESFATIIEAFDEMGLLEALQSDSILEMLTFISGADPECADSEVNILKNTIIYTITGGPECIFSSGTIIISNINKNDDETTFDVEFDNVKSTECSLDGNVEVTINKKVSGQIQINVVPDQMETCNGDIAGTLDVVYDLSTEEVISSSLEFQASYSVDDTDVDIDADLEYASSGQINGPITVTVDGTAYDCTLNNIVIDDTCSVPTAGTITISPDESSDIKEDVVFDFSSTTCANPTVMTTINGRTVTFFIN